MNKRSHQFYRWVVVANVIACTALTGCSQVPSTLNQPEALPQDHPVYGELYDGVYATNRTCCNDEPVQAVLVLSEGRYRLFVRQDEDNAGSPLIVKSGAYAVRNSERLSPHLLLCDARSPAADRFSLMLVDHPNEDGRAVYLASRYIGSARDPDTDLFASDRLVFVTADDLDEWLAVDADKVSIKLEAY